MALLVQSNRFSWNTMIIWVEMFAENVPTV